MAYEKKIEHLALLTMIPNSAIHELKQIQKIFLWANTNPKIKHDTLCYKYKDGGSKNVDIVHKEVSLKCSWVRRLCNENFHYWKLITLHYIEKYSGKEFKFHSNVKILNNILVLFLVFWKESLSCWGKYYSPSLRVP